MHTTASDGWPTPAQLVEHAARRAALNVIAITDHDTIEGALVSGQPDVALTIADRVAILTVLDDPPEGLAELRAVLLAEHVGRRRTGLV